MRRHLVLWPSFSLFQLILSQRIARVTSAERLASPKDVHMLVPFQFVVISEFLMDLTIVLRFGIVCLQFVSGLKLYIDFGLRSVTADCALAIARMN